MLRYVVSRIAQSILVIFGVVCVTFAVLRLVPGDPSSALLPLNAPPEARENLRQELGLDQSLGEQFLVFLGDLFTGDLGTSFRFGQPVDQLVLDALPATLALTGAALVLSCLVAVPLGVITAAKLGSPIDRGSLFVALAAQSMPSFWLGTLLVYQFAIRQPFFPAVGFDGWTSLVLPTVTLSVGMVAILARIVRQSMVETLSEDYIRTARAKGVPEWKVLTVHALRNASLPLITILGLQVGFLLGGAFVVELIFNWPGVGNLALEAMKARDFPVVQGVVILTAAVYVSVNLAIDLLYAYLNPRVRLGIET